MCLSPYLDLGMQLRAFLRIVVSLDPYRLRWIYTDNSFITVSPPVLLHVLCLVVGGLAVVEVVARLVPSICPPFFHLPISMSSNALGVQLHGLGMMYVHLFASDCLLHAGQCSARQYGGFIKCTCLFLMLCSAPHLGQAAYLSEYRGAPPTMPALPCRSY